MLDGYPPSALPSLLMNVTVISLASIPERITTHTSTVVPSSVVYSVFSNPVVTADE